jgi:16S rRNA processing protein RimM
MVPIGRLTKPHGLKGELVLLPYVDDLTVLPELAGLRVYLQCRAHDVREGTISAWRQANKRVLIRLKDCQTVEQAETYQDAEVLIPRHCFSPLPEGEYYWFEIEGLTVYASDRRVLGTITSIIHTGSNDVYVVQGGSQEVLVPAIQDVVSRIDLARGEMHLFAVPGLLDD